MVNITKYSDIIQMEFWNAGFGLGAAPVVWNWLATQATEDEYMVIADLVNPISELGVRRYKYKLAQINSIIEFNPFEVENMIEDHFINTYPKMLESMKKLLELSLSLA